MSVTTSPSNPEQGQTVTFHLKYEGNPPPPDDVHIEVLTPDGWVAVVGYDHIPAGMNPVNGFDIPVPPTPAWSSPGQHSFRVRWTRGGKDIGGEAAYLTSRPHTLPPPPKEWDWKVFWGKVLGGAGGGALSSVLFNWWTGAGVVVCAITGAIGGAGGSAAGQILVYWWDAPRLRWSFRSAALFSLFYSLAFAMVLGLLALGLEREYAARGEVWNRVTLGISGVSAFLAAILGGVIDNLRSDS